MNSKRINVMCYVYDETHEYLSLQMDFAVIQKDNGMNDENNSSRQLSICEHCPERYNYIMYVIRNSRFF